MAKYADMTIEELRGVIRDANAALEEKVSARKAELLAELKELGGSENVVDWTNFDPTKPPRSRSKAGAKDGRSNVKVTHRDPTTGQTWASKGQKPKWLQAHIDAGKNPDDYRVKD